MKQLILRGSPRERGVAHGERMHREIHQALDYYRSRFLSDRVRLEQHIAQLMPKIADFRPDYIEEMDAIAQAANVEPFWIYCLNARSELMSSPASAECSSVAFPEKGLLGQNWDWAEALSGLLTLADIELENGHRFLTMTEPGILAKIGINQAGLGVCLNILPASQRLTGLPVHILLRALLECQTLSEARQLIQQQGSGKASHITVSSPDTALGAELAPEKAFFPTVSNSYYLHTNHYLQPGQAQPTSSKACTETRLARMHTLMESAESLDLGQMKKLLNNNQRPYPILRPYAFHELTGKGGTLVTLMMDLNQRTLYLREGFSPEVSFQTYTVETSSETSSFETTSAPLDLEGAVS